jgi:hypothetical protein
MVSKLEPFIPLAIVAQIGLAILFGVFTTYGSDTTSNALTNVGKYMPFFVDVSTMIFIGFGYLMTFLRKFGYAAVIFTLFVSVFAVQWGMLAIGFGETVHAGSWDSRILLTSQSLIDGLFCAGSVMIAFGALIGKVCCIRVSLFLPFHMDRSERGVVCSCVQVSFQSMTVLAFFQVIFYAINYTVVAKYLHVADIGGSLSIHLFGAYFGLTASAVLSQRGAEAHRRHVEGVEATYYSDIFSLIGTIFLWVRAWLFLGQFVIWNSSLSQVSVCIGADLVAFVQRRAGSTTGAAAGGGQHAALAVRMWLHVHCSEPLSARRQQDPPDRRAERHPRRCADFVSVIAEAARLITFVARRRCDRVHGRHTDQPGWRHCGRHDCSAD